jgi:predicted O-methyltransferase YrrM
VLTWNDAGDLTIGETGFRVGRGETVGAKLPDGSFRLKRDREAIEQLADLVASSQPRNIVELGILHGAGSAFITELAQPQKLVAIDLRTSPVDRLESWIEARGLREVVRTYYGVDQADAAAVRRIIVDEFADEPLDLVVDDGSYYVEAKRASFNELFPRLRPGAVYLIDHWSMDHQFDVALSADASARARIQDVIVDTPRARRLPATVLLFELVLACAYTPELVAQITIHDQWAAIVRGVRPLDPDGFSISSCYGKGGRRLVSGL